MAVPPTNTPNSCFACCMQTALRPRGPRLSWSLPNAAHRTVLQDARNTIPFRPSRELWLAVHVAHSMPAGEPFSCCCQCCCQWEWRQTCQHTPGTTAAYRVKTTARRPCPAPRCNPAGSMCLQSTDSTKLLEAPVGTSSKLQITNSLCKTPHSTAVHSHGKASACLTECGAAGAQPSPLSPSLTCPASPALPSLSQPGACGPWV